MYGYPASHGTPLLDLTSFVRQCPCLMLRGAICPPLQCYNVQNSQVVGNSSLLFLLPDFLWMGVSVQSRSSQMALKTWLIVFLKWLNHRCIIVRIIIIIVQIVFDEDDVVGQEQFGGDQCGQMSASSVHQCQSRSRSRDLAGKYLKPQSIPRYWSLSRKYLFENK